ncbi:MAG: hypothetical protein ACFB9M_16730 [Myxococcota bacterium]
MAILEGTELRTFFESHLAEALEAEALHLPQAHVYLVGLCCEFLSGLQLETPRGERGPPALAWLYAEAQNGPPTRRMEAHRRLGDVALGISGLFAPHLHRPKAVVGPEYYVSMGTAAYATAACLATRSPARAMADVLTQLARHFRSLVEVLVRLAERAGLPSVKEPAALMERLEVYPDSHSTLRTLGQQRLHPVWLKGGTA